MEVILFSMSCLEEKHQERVRQDESRQRRKGRDGRKKSDRAAAFQRKVARWREAKTREGSVRKCVEVRMKNKERRHESEEGR